MKTQKKAMKLISGGRIGRYNAKKSLAEVRLADECRGRYQSGLRSYLAGKWSEENVHIADWMASQTDGAKVAMAWAKYWLPPM